MLITRLLGMTLLLLMFGSSTVYSNEATATDTQQAVVMGQIIQPQGNNATRATAPTPTASQEAVANDLNEGETRTLPSLNEPIVDQANLLNPAQKQQISQTILQLHQQGKAQIGVVIVPTTGQEDIFSFAMRVAEQWQLGSAQRDNGLLMAIAVNDRRIQILTGYGLEGVMPDIITSRIIHQHITPYFAQGRYAEGIASGLGQIQTILNQDPEIAAQAAQELQQRQQQALQEQQAREKTLSTALFILIAGVFASYIVGRRLSASTAAVAGLVAGLVNGAGLITSVLLAGGIFVLLISSVAQLILQMFLSGAGRGGGGGLGGGGYRGGGGGFGGGGASGSW